MSIKIVRTYTCDQCKKDATADSRSRDDTWFTMEIKVNNGCDKRDQEQMHVCGFKCAHEAMVKHQKKNGTIRWIKMDELFQ